MRTHFRNLAGASLANLEPQMRDQIDQLVKRAIRQSPWVEDGLFSTGNYYWVNLGRDRASEFYRRTLELFPDGQKRPTGLLARSLDRVSGAQAGSRGHAGKRMCAAVPTSSYVQDD